MAEKPKSNVGVVLINGLGFYKSKIFKHLSALHHSPRLSSFLVVNMNFFTLAATKLLRR